MMLIPEYVFCLPPPGLSFLLYALTACTVDCKAAASRFVVGRQGILLPWIIITVQVRALQTLF